nr:Gag-Pol polyprotein [Tanacetum cinerariifolium]
MEILLESTSNKLMVDADLAGCIDSRKSTCGGIQFLGDKLVSWMAKKQNCTAMSSAEAEYVALSASCIRKALVMLEILSMRFFLKLNLSDRRMRMEQYIQMIDYSLWEVIENGNAPPITKVIEGVETTIAPTAKEKAQRSVSDIVLPSFGIRASGVNLVKKVAKSDLDSDASIRLRFVLDCVLSWTAFCQALRFAYLKTIFCVLLRTNSAKLKIALRFVSCCVLPKKTAF